MMFTGLTTNSSDSSAIYTIASNHFLFFVLYRSESDHNIGDSAQSTLLCSAVYFRSQCPNLFRSSDGIPCDDRHLIMDGARLLQIDVLVLPSPLAIRWDTQCIRSQRSLATENLPTAGRTSTPRPAFRISNPIQTIVDQIHRNAPGLGLQTNLDCPACRPGFGEHDPGPTHPRLKL